MGAFAVALISGLAGVILGSVLTAIVSYWLQRQSQAHERAIAIFNVKADELRSVTSQRDGFIEQYIKASEWCNHFVSVSPNAPEAYSASDKKELRETIRALGQRAELMRFEYLTLSKPLLEAISEFRMAYSHAAGSLEVSLFSLKLDDLGGLTTRISSAEKSLQQALKQEVDRFLDGEDVVLIKARPPRLPPRLRRA